MTYRNTGHQFAIGIIAALARTIRRMDPDEILALGMGAIVFIAVLLAIAL